jgi:hypothetical protein
VHDVKCFEFVAIVNRFLVDHADRFRGPFYCGYYCLRHLLSLLSAGLSAFMTCSGHSVVVAIGRHLRQPPLRAPALCRSEGGAAIFRRHGTAEESSVLE